jgi:hypothetical protein
MIPKIIHQTWSDKLLPPIIKSICSENTKILKSKGYEIKLWTDSDIIDLIKDNYPDFYNIYTSAKTGVQRGDMSRIIIIYHFGGIYIDLDVLVLRDFAELLDMNSDKFYVSYEPSGQTMALYNSDRYICNAFFAANKNNRFVSKLLRNIPNYLNQYGLNVFNRFDVFGGAYFLSNINKYTNEGYADDMFIIEDRELIYPINDLKFDGMKFTVDDWTCVKNGVYPSNPIMIHYWIHGDFESKNLLNVFKPTKDKNIHENVYLFFKKLYPGIAEKIDNIK